MPYSTTEARARFADLIKEAEDEVVQITQHNIPKAALMSWEVYESLIETLEILSDPEMMEGIRQGEKDIEDGNVYPWEDVKRELGI